MQGTVPARHVIAVASGKGGVGKSSIALNAATLLAQQGARVGLVDCDVSIRREGGEAVPVGTAGPFPVDHPSELRLPLTPATSEVALGPGPEVTVELASALPEQPLNPRLRLTVAAAITA